MTVTTLITLSPEELEALISKAIAPYAEAVRSIEVKIGIHKHAYTVAEVAEKIGYSKRIVLDFIRNGRKDGRNKIRRLPHLEVTTGEYRVLPSDLENWLSYFQIR